MRSRLAVPLVVTALVAPIGLTGCQVLDGGEGPEPVVETLVEGVSSGDLSAVPFDAAGAVAAYAALVEGIGEVTPSVTADDPEVTDDTATAGLTWTWDLEGQEWTYDTTVDLARVEDEWEVVWEPALVESSLP